jgi:hypothetical protein
MCVGTEAKNLGIFTAAKEAVKQSGSLHRCGYPRLPALRRSIRGLRRMQCWSPCLWNRHAMRNQEASQTSVLFQQSTNFHGGYSFGYRHQFGSISDNYAKLLMGSHLWISEITLDFAYLS